MTKNGIQALTELLNSRSKWVRDRAMVINMELRNSEKVHSNKVDLSCGVPEDSFYYGREQTRGWSGDWYAHHDSCE